MGNEFEINIKIIKNRRDEYIRDALVWIKKPKTPYNEVAVELYRARVEELDWVLDVLLENGVGTEKGSD